jgi:raffinose/stachyose/melibiose transport system substrate-binding protein
VKKKAAALLLIVFAALGLLGCGGSSKGTQVTLKIWWWGEQEAPGLKNFMDKAFAAYMNENPNIKIEPVLQEIDTLYPAFRAAAKAKEGPDIQYFWGGTRALEDVWMGSVAPLSDFWSAEDIDRLPYFQRAETFWDGKQWCMPFYQYGSPIGYNKKLFAKAGLDPENPPKTWDEFLVACEKLKVAGIIPIGAGIKDGYFGGWIISYLGQQNMDSPQDLMNIITGKDAAGYTDPKNYEWIIRLKELWSKGYFNQDIMSLDLYQGQQLYEAGSAAMTMAAEPYFAVMERKLGRDTVAVMRNPVFGKGKMAYSTGVPSQVLAITSFSKHKKEAAKFLKFLHREDMMKLMYQEAGAICPDKGFKDEWLNTQVDKDIMKWVKELPLFWYQYYYPMAFEQTGTGVNSIVQQIFAENISAEQAGKNLQDALVKWRAQNPEQFAAFSKWKLLQQK